MNKLEEARQIINNVDEELIDLFKKRMVASKMVALYKKENDMPIFDAKREEELIKNNCLKLNDKELEIYYKEFLKSILKISKDYQKDLINK